MAEQSAGNRGWIAALCVIVVGIGAWWAWRPAPEVPAPRAPETKAQPQVAPIRIVDEQSAAPTPDGPPPPLPIPDYLIEERGRLSILAAYLPEKEVVSFALALPDEARGEESLAAVIVSVSDKRRIEATATPNAGSGTGVRLEMEARWLTPGLYMIQLSTAEKTPLALRRYVLEIK